MAKGKAFNANKNKLKLVQWSDRITNIQCSILEGLSRYKFLTLTQMLELKNIGTTQYPYIWKQAASLKRRGKPLISSHSFGSPAPKKGKVEDMYYLKMNGRKTLVEELRVPIEKIKMPIGSNPIMAYKDYHHRKRQIDFQVWLDKWAFDKGYFIPYFDCYFDKVGNNRTSKNLKAKTSIQITDSESFIPDGAFEVIDQTGKKNFYLFEMYNDKNTLRIVEQIHKHAKAMINRSTHKKYNLTKNRSYRVVLFFNFPAIKKSVIGRIKAEGEMFEHIHKYFICNSMDNLRKENFFDTFQTIRSDWTNF